MGKKQLSPSIKKDFSDINSYSFSRKIQMLPLSKVFPNDKNFYRVTDEEVTLLMEDIENQGLKHNLVVKANNDGTYTIISGHKRYTAVKRLHEEKGYADTLPCLVEQFNSEDEEMQALIMLNVTNRKLTDSEIMRGYEELKGIFDRQKSDKQVKGRIRELVAEALQVSNSQVRRIENINNNAIEEVKTLVNENKISINTADKIAVLDVEKQKEIVTNPDISALDEIKPNDIIKNCDLKDTIFDNKKRVLKDTNTNTVNSADDVKSCDLKDTKSDTVSSSNEVKNCVLKDTKTNTGKSTYTPEEIINALESLFYNDDDITKILKRLEKNKQ
jgi:ParB family chromosome partitioning protein